MKYKKIYEYICSNLENFHSINTLEEIEILKLNFIEEGFIDSYSLIHLISDIESQFKIQFNPEDLESEEFKTIGGLINIIMKRTE
jgi:acyl carrier protein